MRPLCCAVLAAVLAVGCDEPKKETPKAKPAESTKDVEDKPAPKPAGPPELKVTADELKVGWELVLLEQREGPEKLKRLIGESKSYFEGKSVPIVAEPKARVDWMQALMKELAAVGATSFLVKTETRKTYPGELTFTPPGAVKSPQPCTLVSMILEDRATATWRIAGGTAMKRPKGLAGPDLSMTQETMERLAGGCKGSSTLFVSGAKVIEWGLIYDLAAAASKIEKAKLDQFVLLPEIPVAGRKVELGG